MSRRKGKTSIADFPKTSARDRPEMRSIALFHAVNLNSQSNANMPSTLASINRVNSSVESFSKLRIGTIRRSLSRREQH